MKNRKLMIYFLDDQNLFDVTYSQKILIRRAVEATLKYENYENDAEISVTFTDNEGIRKLNRDFRNLDKPTDVLSFPLTDYEATNVPPAEEISFGLGDVVLSLERAKEQADEYGHSFDREIAFLVVHSMLHLLGYDHETGEEDELDMRQRQSEILKNMGLEVKN